MNLLKQRVLSVDDFNPFPDLPQKQEPQKNTQLFIILVITLVCTGFTYYYMFSKQPSSSGPNISEYSSSSQPVDAAPTPTPKPLPSGKQVYRFSHGSKVVGPKPTTATIDPIDPELKDKQVFLVEINHPDPIEQVNAILKTDNKETPMTLKLSSGNETNGTWMVGWKAKDTYNYTYQIEFTAVDTNNQSNTNTLTFR